MNFDKRIEEILNIATAIKPANIPKEEILKGMKGTTVVAVRYKTGIIIGSDTLVTRNYSRAGNVQKIFIVDNFTVMGVAGVYALCQWRVNQFKYEIKSWENELKKRISMEGRAKIFSRHLFVNPGMMVALLGLGEYNGENFSLVKYDEIGAQILVDFAAIGSGENDANPILQEFNKENPVRELDFEPAKELVLKALKRAAENNIGTGSSFELVILDKQGARFLGGEK